MHEVTLRHRLRVHRSDLRASVVDRALHAFVRARYAMPDATPSHFHVALRRDLPYRPTGDGAHMLDVFMPTRTPKPLPTILYVHGGGFSMCSKETHRVMALAYARRGYLVFLINYRLGRKNLFPAPLEDAAEALLWVRDNCAYFGGDPSRIAIAGESAGGNLVTALALASSQKRTEPVAKKLFAANVKLRAVIATYGFLDVESLEHYERHPRLSSSLKDLVLHAATSYVGVDVRAGAAAHPLASPLLVLERTSKLDRDLPPFFVDVGTRDPLFGDSRRLKAAIEGHGGSCHLHIAPGEIHGYDALVWRGPAKEKWRRVHDFLADRMAGEPRAERGEEARREAAHDPAA